MAGHDAKNGKTAAGEPAFAGFFIGSLIAACVLYAGIGERAPLAVRLSVVWCSIFLAPGFFLYPFFFRDDLQLVLVEKAALWFGLSLAALFFPVMACWFVPTSPETLAWRCLAASGGCAAIGLFARRFPRLMSGNTENARAFAHASWEGRLALGLCAFSFLFTYRLGGELGEDTQIHLLVLRKLADRPFLDLNDLYYKGLGTDTQYSHLFWHPVLTTVAALSKSGNLAVWSKIPAFLTTASIGATYLLTKSFLPGRSGERAGLAAAALLCLCLGGLIYKDCGFRELNAPYGAARWAVYPIVCHLYLMSFEKKSKPVLALAAFLPLVMAAIHLFYWILFVLGAAAHAAFLAIPSRARNASFVPAVKRIAAIALVSLPYLALRWESYEVAHPIKADPVLTAGIPYLHGSLAAIDSSWHYASPFFVFWKIYILFYERPFLAPLAFVAAAWLHRHYQNDFRRLFLTAPFAAVPLLMLNPLTIKILENGLTWMYAIVLNQGLLFVETSALFLFLGARSWRNTLTQRLSDRVARAVVAGGLVCLLFSLTVPNLGRIADSLTHPEPVERVLPTPVERESLKLIPAGSTVLAQPWEAFKILGVANLYTAGLPMEWLSPTDPEVLDRERETWCALDPESGLAETLAILKKREVDFVLTTPKSDMAALDEKFSSSGGALTKIYERPEAALYRVDRSRID